MRDVRAHFHPVLRASRLRRGPVRVVVGGVGYALWRDATGTPRALIDRCPHRHAPLSKGFVRPDGRLACGYHGWHFDGDGDGKSPAVPNLGTRAGSDHPASASARTPEPCGEGSPRRGTCTAATAQLAERFGWLWLAGAGRGANPVPELGADGWDYVGSHAQTAPAPLHVVVDNFSENEHTPYVHGRLGWREEDSPEVDVDVACHADRTEVTYRAPQRPSALLPLVCVERGDELWNQWVTRFSPVHSIYTLSWRDPKTGAPRPYALRVAICFVPETERRTNIVSFMFSRLAPGSYRIPRKVRDAAAFAMGWKEVWDDARWVRHIADTQEGFAGMRLTRFDKPLAHNRKLMDALYYRAAEATLIQLAPRA